MDTDCLLTRVDEVSSKSSMPYADAQEATVMGWVKENSDIKRHPVCGFGPTVLGCVTLRVMSGNGVGILLQII